MLCANDEQLEVEAVLAGHVIGPLTSATATAHIRAGRLVPLLTAHVTDHLGVYVSRKPDLATRACADFYRTGDCAACGQSPAYRLTAKELAAAEAAGRKAVWA